jgi:acyl-lipid omega-6 desaturase (Delta-12 desaturase)
LSDTAKPVSPASPPSDARNWVPVLAQFQKPATGRGIAEIAITVLPLIGFWFLALAALQISPVLALLLAVPAAGFLVRMFMIQHDCGHGAFFGNKNANDWTGRVIGVLTLTPYDFWKRTHALHHANSGHLDRRGFGDVNTLTVAEYKALSLRGRIGYRLYRHPLVMFGLGPLYIFVLQHRLPVGLMRKGWQPWISTMGTNAGILAIIALTMIFAGYDAVLFVHLPIVLMAGSIGIWLFFVQHQFENTLWEDSQDWTWHEAALYGSSHYRLPAVLRWFTANIGIHHVHHLSSRIPYYRLPKVLRDHPELGEINPLSLFDGLRCIRLVLWDETARRLVSFREARAAA